MTLGSEQHSANDSKNIIKVKFVFTKYGLFDYEYTSEYDRVL